MTASRLLPKMFLLLVSIVAAGIYVCSLKGIFKHTLFEPLSLHPTVLAPAAFSFYIFALILAGLLGLSVFQFFPKQPMNKRLAKSRFYLSASLLLFAWWAMTWCYDLLFASAVGAVLMAVALGRAAMQLELRTTAMPSEVWLLRAPTMLFWGWVLFLAVVNWAMLFQSLKWKLGWLTPDAWAVLLMLTLASVSLWLCLHYLDVFAITAVAWGFLGIALKKEMSVSMGRMVWLSIFVMVLVILIRAPRKWLEEV